MYAWRDKASTQVSVPIHRSLTHPAGVEVEWDALAVALQDLFQVPVGKEDAAFQERVGGPACHPLYPERCTPSSGGQGSWESWQQHT